VLPHAGVVLWKNDIGSYEMIQKVNILRAHGVPRVCVAGAGAIHSQPNEGTFLTTLYEAKPVGSFIAMIRALRYCQSSFALGNDVTDKGIVVMYSRCNISPMMLDKLFQLSTLGDVQPIDMFMMVRLHTDSPNSKFIIGQMGKIEQTHVVPRGFESDGLVYITKRFFNDLVNCPARDMREFYTWCLKEGKWVQAVINSCCGQ
jgi:hypothetical protein